MSYTGHFVMRACTDSEWDVPALGGNRGGLMMGDTNIALDPDELLRMRETAKASLERLLTSRSWMAAWSHQIQPTDPDPIQFTA